MLTFKQHSKNWGCKMLGYMKRMTERAIILQRYERGETPESIAEHLCWSVRQVRNLLVLRGVWKGE